MPVEGHAGFANFDGELGSVRDRLAAGAPRPTIHVVGDDATGKSSFLEEIVTTATVPSAYVNLRGDDYTLVALTSDLEFQFGFTPPKRPVRLPKITVKDNKLVGSSIRIMLGRTGEQALDALCEKLGQVPSAIVAIDHLDPEHCAARTCAAAIRVAKRLRACGNVTVLLAANSETHLKELTGEPPLRIKLGDFPCDEFVKLCQDSGYPQERPFLEGFWARGPRNIGALRDVMRTLEREL